MDHAHGGCSCGGAHSCKDETDKIGGHFEDDYPPGVCDVDFGIRVLCQFFDLLFVEFYFHGLGCFSLQRY